MMKENSGYDQFIEGKVCGGTNYEIVAHTANLSDTDEMNAIAVRYGKFFKEAPYENPQAMAIGVFRRNEELIVVQASHALDQRGCLVKDYYDREFSQSRYVFIPSEVITQLQGKTFKLIHWIKKQRISVLTEAEPDLSPISAQLLQESLSQVTYPEELQKATEKICLCLADRTEGKSTLLMVIAALLNQQRIIIDWAPDTTLPPYYLDSILLLLPAPVRSQVAFAFGDLNEQVCDWARLMIKSNGVPRAMPDDLIWLDCHTHRFTEQINAGIFIHGYVEHFLQHLTAPEKIVELLQKLDAIQIDCNGLNTLLNTEILIHLLPLLSEPQRHIAYEMYFSGLSVTQWHRIIPLIEDIDQQGLIFAWKQLSAVMSDSGQRSQVVALMLQVWKRLVQPNAVPLLQSLKDSPPLAESLLLSGLLQQSNYISKDHPVQQELVALSQFAVAAKAKQSTATAWQLAEKLAQDSRFQINPIDRFNLFDAALAGELQVEELLQRFCQSLAILLPHLSTTQFQESHLARQCTRKNRTINDLIINLLSNHYHALDRLPELADFLGFKASDCDAFYAAFLNIWSPPFEAARQLLIALIQQARSHNSPFDPHLLEQTCTWFKHQNPELEPIFPQIHHQLQNWQTWKQLATALFENPSQQVTFLEAEVGEQFSIEVLQTHLCLIKGDQRSIKQFVQNNQLWKRLRFEGLSQLVVESPRFAPLLARCLKEDRRLDWLKGELLHCLCQRWIDLKFVEDDLKLLINTVQVSEAWDDRDWVELQQVEWTPGIELYLPLKRPILQDEQKRHLFNYARKAIDLYGSSEQLQNLLHDCHAWRLDSHYLKTLAMQIVQRCDQPEQIQKLLADCLTWQLTLTEQKAVLAQAKPEVCTVELIFRYLDCDRSQIHILENFTLVRLLFQVPGQTQTETLQIKKLAIDVLRDSILNNDPLIVKRWREQIFGTNKLSYQEVLVEATKNVVLNYLPQVETFFQELKRSAMTEEAELIRDAIFSKLNESFYLPISSTNESISAETSLK